MELKYTTYRIKLVHSFNISRSKNSWYDITYIYLIDGDIIGRGEAAPSIRYNESNEKIYSCLRKIKLSQDKFNLNSIREYIIPKLNKIKSLESAFDMAILDWWAQKKNVTVSNLLNVNRGELKPTSFTIGISNIGEIAQKIEEAKPYKILKVKLGTKNSDMDIITEIRRHTDKIIRVDANEGWSIDNAIKLSYWLADRNVELIEQPFPADALQDNLILKNKSPIDIYADENSINSQSIDQIKLFFHGINIKLMKCGSLFEALKMIKLAKEFKLKVMLGCMVESSVAITAASQIAKLADKLDLDGNLLIKNDPYHGVLIKEGHLLLPDKPGLGLSLKKKYPGLF